MQLPCAQEPDPLQERPMTSLHYGAYGHDEAGPSQVMRQDPHEAGPSQVFTQGGGKYL